MNFNLQNFLDELSNPTPVPGGGSASAVCSLLGVSLIEMVSGISKNKKVYREMSDSLKEEYEKYFLKLQEIKPSLEKLIEEDSNAYTEVMKAYKMEDCDEKNDAIEASLKKAINSPYEICLLSHSSIKILDFFIDKTIKSAITDLGSALNMLNAGFNSALLNVKVNFSDLNDEEFKVSTKKNLDKFKVEIDEITERISKYIDKSLN